MKDFFVSYNSHDRAWAEWIAWTLEEAGYSVVIQAWDFRPGGNFVLDMQRAAADTERTIAVLSDHYLQAEYTQPEWAAAFAKDPQSLKRLMIPVRVQSCQVDGMLAQIVYVDLVGISQADAQQRLLDMLQERAKPAIAPAFPGQGGEPTPASPTPIFPGSAPENESVPSSPALILGVYGWDGLRSPTPATIELDWRSHCDRESRTIPSMEVWETVLLPELKHAKQQLSELSSDRHLELYGNRPLTMTLAIGATFPAVAGYTFQLQQMVGGQPQWWNTAATPSAARLKVCREQGMEGEHLLFAIGVSRDIWEDVRSFYQACSTPLSSLVYVEPEAGTGQQALGSDGDAMALAIAAKQLMGEYRDRYRAKQLHLIVACPATFALMLGQQLNALGKVMTYERTEDGDYQASVSLRTG